jgi:hypothetical protein
MGRRRGVRFQRGGVCGDGFEVAAVVVEMRDIWRA